MTVFSEFEETVSVQITWDILATDEDLRVIESLSFPFFGAWNFVRYDWKSLSLRLQEKWIRVVQKVLVRMCFRGLLSFPK